jgi:hypothetical protein
MTELRRRSLVSPWSRVGRAVVATDSKGEEHELVVGGQSN